MASAPAVCAVAKPESIEGMRVSRRVRCIQIESVGRITLDVVERGLDGWREETVILAVVCIREDTFLEGGGGQIADRILETKELHERAYCIESLTPQGTSMTVFRLATSLSSEISGGELRSLYAHCHRTSILYGRKFSDGNILGQSSISTFCTDFIFVQ